MYQVKQLKKKNYTRVDHELTRKADPNASNIIIRHRFIWFPCRLPSWAYLKMPLLPTGICSCSSRSSNSSSTTTITCTFVYLPARIDTSKIPRSLEVTDSEAETSRFTQEFAPAGRDPMGSCLAEAFSTTVFTGRAARPPPGLLPRARRAWPRYRWRRRTERRATTRPAGIFRGGSLEAAARFDFGLHAARFFLVLLLRGDLDLGFSRRASTSGSSASPFRRCPPSRERATRLRPGRTLVVPMVRRFCLYHA